MNDGSAFLTREEILVFVRVDSNPNDHEQQLNTLAITIPPTLPSQKKTHTTAPTITDVPMPCVLRPIGANT